MKTTTLLSCLLLVGPLLDASAKESANAPQSEQSFQREITRTLALDYLLYLPRDYQAKADESWPLLVFLHGSGERGDDLEKVKIHGPPMLIEAGKEFPFIVVSPQCPPDQWWDPEAVMGLIEEIEADHRVDPKRIYLTGLSMGGFGTWDLVGRHPEKFAAAAPICGGGNWLLARDLGQVPLWVFHGAKDNAVPLSESERLVNLIKGKGSEHIKFTVYPEAGHNSWTESYDNPELYEWFLSHSLPHPAAKE
ncbi:MAG: prolyl oligopeptidase family serine peptidase, partial [Verrucomicrobiales bacterium]